MIGIVLVMGLEEESRRGENISAFSVALVELELEPQCPELLLPPGL